MIPQLKALTKWSLNQERNWGWHDLGGGHALLVEKATLFTKTCLKPLMTELFSISKLLSSTTIEGFLLRYITFFYLNWPRNGEPSTFEVQKNCLNYDDLYSKTHVFGTLFEVRKLMARHFQAS